MKKKWTPGKITAAVIGGIAAACILIVAFYVGIFQLARNIMVFEQAFNEAMGEESAKEKDSVSAKEDPLPDEDDADEWFDDWTDDGGNDQDDSEAWQDDEKDSFWDSDEYYEFHSVINSDLSYQVSIKEFVQYAETNAHSMMTGNYPVVECEDSKKADRINAAIKREMEIVSNHVNSIGENLREDECFVFSMESFVTYMEEDILSVIYEEYAFLDEEIYETYVVCVNIDMESGIAMTNSQILEIDDEFSIDFRKRSEKQNGESGTMDYYSDQELTALMNDDSTLIIFYTPLGMEVGFNYYYGWVTVTYPDYAKYQNPL